MAASLPLQGGVSENRYTAGVIANQTQTALSRKAVIGRHGDLGRSPVRAEQWPAAMEHILQPRTCKLRRNDGNQHQSRVELGVNDPGIEGDARQDDAGAATGIGRERQIDEIKAAEPSESTCK